MEQLTLFDLMEQRSDFPCDNCVFDRCGRCVHVENEGVLLRDGQLPDQAEGHYLPALRERMEVIQSVFGDDGAQCSCGMRKIFNNKGNRLTAFELWKQGRLVGT